MKIIDLSPITNTLISGTVNKNKTMWTKKDVQMSKDETIQIIARWCENHLEVGECQKFIGKNDTITVTRTLNTDK